MLWWVGDAKTCSGQILYGLVYTCPFFAVLHLWVFVLTYNPVMFQMMVPNNRTFEVTEVTPSWLDLTLDPLYVCPDASQPLLSMDFPWLWQWSRCISQIINMFCKNKSFNVPLTYSWQWCHCSFCFYKWCTPELWCQFFVSRFCYWSLRNEGL